MPVDTLFLVIGAGVVGLVVGWAIGRTRRRRDRLLSDFAIQRRRAWSTWLSSRLRLNRAAMRTVAAARSLHKSSSGACSQSLRMKEAHGARREWHRAAQRLDHAYAVLLTECEAFDLPEQIGRLQPLDVDLVNAAMCGDDGALSELQQRLRTQECQALAWVRDHFRQPARPPLTGRILRLVGSLTRPLDRVITRWSEPP